MPIALLLHFILTARSRNAFLMLASFAFYFLDAGLASMVLLGSVIVNAAIGNALYRIPANGRACALPGAWLPTDPADPLQASHRLSLKRSRCLSCG